MSVKATAGMGASMRISALQQASRMAAKNRLLARILSTGPSKGWRKSWAMKASPQQANAMETNMKWRRAGRFRQRMKNITASTRAMTGLSNAKKNCPVTRFSLRFQKDNGSVFTQRA